MCFSMPEAFIHGLRYNATVLFVRFLNTCPVPRSPHSCRASSLIGRIAAVEVFFVIMSIPQPPSANLTMFSHWSLMQSERRRPVRHEKRPARRRTLLLQGV